MFTRSMTGVGDYGEIKDISGFSNYSWGSSSTDNKVGRVYSSTNHAPHTQCSEQKDILITPPPSPYQEINRSNEVHPSGKTASQQNLETIGCFGSALTDATLAGMSAVSLDLEGFVSNSVATAMDFVDLNKSNKLTIEMMKYQAEAKEKNDVLESARQVELHKREMEEWAALQHEKKYFLNQQDNNSNSRSGPNLTPEQWCTQDRW